MIKDQDKTFENKLHFIFFVLKKGSTNLQGNNINELFKALNDSKCPVYFIINHASKNKKKNASTIQSVIEYLERADYKNLSDENNFIACNFKKEDELDVHGIDKIFKKMQEHINEKQYLENNLKNKMFELKKNFTSYIENRKNFGSFENEDLINIRDSKLEIGFNEKMKEIINLANENYLFSKINVATIIENGKKIAENCKNIIISLSKLKGILPNISQSIPAISILQAVMIKETAQGYGLDFNILNAGTKFLSKNISNLNLNKKQKDHKKEDNNKNSIKTIYNPKEINKALDTLESQIKDKLEKGNNKKTILTLAKILNIIYNENLKMKPDNINQYLFNITFTNEVSEYCMKYFERELKESKGLIFMVNYFNKCESLLKDLEVYINKKDWDNYEIEIKK